MKHFYIGIHPECGKVHASLAEDEHTGVAIQQALREWRAAGWEVKRVTEEEYRELEWHRPHEEQG